MRRNFRHFLYPLLLLSEALIFHRRVLFYTGYLFPWDFRGVHLPLATFLAASFRRGEWPLWDPYTYCGVPIYANIQSALFYPPMLAATLAGAWLGDEILPRLLAISVVSQIVFAGVCTFALLRRIGAAPAAAWLAASMFELGCFFASQAEHMGAMQAAAWLPLIWWCIIELRERMRWFWTAVLAFALGMTILAGLPQVAVAAFFSAVLLALIMASAGLFRWRSLPSIAIACGWSFLLAAVQLAPSTELTLNSVAKYRSEWLGSGGGIPFGALASLLIPNYWSVFDPAHFHGPVDLTFLYLYSSLLGLALALLAIFRNPNRWVLSFTALTAVLVFVMLGEHTPLWRLLFPWLPVNIRIGIHPEFFFCAFSLALAILAGMGANRFLTPRWQIGAGIVIACDLIFVGSARPMNSVSIQQEPGFTHNSAQGSVVLMDRLRDLTGRTNPPSRFDTRPELPFSWENNAPLFAIPSASGCDPLAPERIIQARLSFSPGPRWGTCFHVVDLNSRVLDLFNDAVLVARGPIENPRFSLAAEVGGFKLYRNITVLPRFFLVSRLQPVQTLEQAAGWLHRADFDPAATAIVETGQAPASSPTSASQPGHVAVLDYRPTHLALSIHTPSNSFLVITDSYYPGWLATLDGKPASVYATDVAFRGLAVPAGTHQVEMHFNPRILWWSAAVSVAAWLLVLLCIAA